MTEIGQIPFALCEIVALAESAQQNDIAFLANSMVDLLLGCGDLRLLELPQVAKEEIQQILARHDPANWGRMEPHEVPS